MDKLSKFPLQAAGFTDAPDETVIVAWPGWSLTVGDVRAARTAPQHSVTEQALSSGMQNQAEFRAACVKRGMQPSQELFTLWQDARAQPLASTAATQPEQASGDKPLRLPAPPDELIENYLTMDATYHEHLVRTYARASALAALAIPASTAANEQQANLSDTKELIDYCDKWCGKVPQDMIAKARIELAHPYTKGQ